jgi:hypothetical protein
MIAGIKGSPGLLDGMSTSGKLGEAQEDRSLRKISPEK